MQHYQTLGMLSIFPFLLFFCRHLLSDFYQDHYQSVEQFCRSDLCPKCLQRLSADDQSWHKKERHQAIQGFMYMLER